MMAHKPLAARWPCGDFVEHAVADSRSAEHLRFAAAFEQRATTTKPSRLRNHLLKLAKLHRELAAQAELRRLIREKSRRPARPSSR